MNTAPAAPVSLNEPPYHSQPAPFMTAPHWHATLQDGDKAAFQDLVEQHLETLTEAAAEALDYYVRQGHLHRNDFNAEEIVGAGLIQAWEHRERAPEQMSLPGWLLGTQYRTLRGMVQRWRQYRAEKALSLDAPLPVNDVAYDTQEWFWDWYQPEKALTWEDVTPTQRQVDVEVPLEGGREALQDPDTWHVLTMHDHFEMDVNEVAFIMGRSVNETAGLIEEARTTLRTRMGADTSSEIRETDHPNPPPGSDR